MRRRRTARFAVLALCTAVSLVSPGQLHAQDTGPGNALIGRWDLTIAWGRRSVPSWLEISRSGSRYLVGRFVHGGGSARPVARVRPTEDGRGFRFTIPPQWESDTLDLVFEGTLVGDDSLTGWTTTASGERLTWTAHRAPALTRTGSPTWGPPEPLLDGRSLAGWRPLGNDSKWRVVDGVLENTAGGANLVTEARYRDFRITGEVRVPPGGNSGVYLRGRYEMQVEDSHGREPTPVGMGAIYGFLTPNQAATKPAGEWQSFDITLVGRRVTVVLNGVTVIADAVIPGITGGALDSDEGSDGPIYLQGDHGPVAYRNLMIRRAQF